MYFVKTPKLFTKIFPDIIWECPSGKPEFHLTFDDGPTANTHQILDTLAEHGIIASFFCLGQAIEKYPHEFERIKQDGHIIGNHGYAHLDGWKTKNDHYLEDIKKGYELTNSTLFRPPYGRLKNKQFHSIKEQFQIIMWSLMPGDFDENVTAKKCARRISKANQKDIIVLHDNAHSKVNQILDLSLNSQDLS